MGLGEEEEGHEERKKNGGGEVGNACPTSVSREAWSSCLSIKAFEGSFLGQHHKALHVQEGYIFCMTCENL